MWFVAACASALFAGIVSIFVKCGVRTTDSDVATAIRTCVVLVFAWAMALITGGIDGLSSLSMGTVVLLELSGLATGASWLSFRDLTSSQEKGRMQRDLTGPSQKETNDPSCFHGSPFDDRGLDARDPSCTIGVLLLKSLLMR